MCSHTWSIFQYWWSGACPQKFDTYGFSWNFSFDTWLYYFGLTFLIETPLYFLFLKKWLPFKKILLASLIVNLASHPLVYLLFPRIADQYGITYGWYVLYAECFAIAVEGLLLWRVFKINARYAFPISIAVNVFSWLIGGELVQSVLN